MCDERNYTKAHFDQIVVTIIVWQIASNVFMCAQRKQSERLTFDQQTTHR